MPAKYVGDSSYIGSLVVLVVLLDFVFFAILIPCNLLLVYWGSLRDWLSRKLDNFNCQCRKQFYWYITNKFHWIKTKENKTLETQKANKWKQVLDLLVFISTPSRIAAILSILLKKFLQELPLKSDESIPIIKSLKNRARYKNSPV